MAAQPNAPLHAAIMTHLFNKDGNKMNSMLSHFKAQYDEDSGWAVEDADITKGSGSGDDQIMFNMDDVAFMKKYYQTEKGKELIRLFLENKEGFPSARDIETVESNLRAVAKIEAQKASEKARVELRVSEMANEKTRLDQELLAARNNTTNIKNEIAQLREEIAGNVTLEGASMATRFQNFLNNSDMY
tara:strand:+ start:2509 stop:3072 length:564 start_codon:yes stop_codon:yes gene_type:complete